MQYDDNVMQYYTTLYNTIQISLHCNVIQYPVILNNAIEHTKYPAIQQNTIEYSQYSQQSPRGSETTRAFYKLQTGLIKLGRVVDPKQPPLSV